MRGHRPTLVVDRGAPKGPNRTDLPTLLGRLAGRGLRPATAADLHTAWAQVGPLPPLAHLGSIAFRVGFGAAFLSTLEAAWWAGLDLASIAAEPGAHPRWADLAALEARVRAHLPRGVHPPAELVARALPRLAASAPALGPIVLHRVTDVPLVARPVIEALARVTDLTWRSPYPADVHPYHPVGVAIAFPTDRSDGGVAAFSAADPTEELRAALAWARGLLDAGVPPGEIGLVALDPGPYEATLLALTQRGGGWLHHREGVPAIDTPVGQLLYAWCDAARRDATPPDAPRFARLIAAAHAFARAGGDLPPAWMAIGERADGEPTPVAPHPAGDRASTIADAPASGSAAVAPATVLAGRLADDGFAPDLLAAYLPDDALALWHRIGDPAAATSLETWRRLRLPDGRDPERSVAWGSARSFVLGPRPYLRLLGVVSGAWPRPHRDDPLLPTPFLDGRPLRTRRRGREDRDDFVALRAAATGAFTLSYPRRGDDGRERLPSPLLLGCVPADAIGVDEALSAGWPLAGVSDAVAAAAAAFAARARPEVTPFDGLLPARHPLVRRALARPLTTSDLRSLLHDPFRFVARRILHLREPPLDDDPLRIDRAAFGSLVHALIERAAGLMGADVARVPSAAPLPLADALATAALHEDAAARAVHPPAGEAVWQGTLAEAVALARAALSGGAPVGPHAAFELRFGAPDGQRARLGGRWDETRSVPLPSSRLRLRGVIDRLDLAPTSAQVTDHKTGGAESEAALARAGELQRIVYALAVRARLGATFEVDASLHYLRSGVRRDLSDEALRERLDALLPAVRDAARRLERGVALPLTVGEDDRHPFALLLPADAARYGERKRAAFRALAGS